MIWGTPLLAGDIATFIVLDIRVKVGERLWLTDLCYLFRDLSDEGLHLQGS